MTADGRVFGIDKEQGFRYFGNDKLSVDYHPNSQYGEQEPYSNTFWKGWVSGSVGYDPKKALGAIEKVQAIDDNAYRDALRPYFQSIFGETQQAADKLETAMKRKANLGPDFEAFFTDLYKRKTKKSGAFTFADGWVPSDSMSTLDTKSKTGLALLKDMGGNVKAVKPGHGSTSDVRLRISTSTPFSHLEDLAKKLNLTVNGTHMGKTYNYVMVDKKEWEAATHTWDEPSEKVLHPSKAKSVDPPTIPIRR